MKNNNINNKVVRLITVACASSMFLFGSACREDDKAKKEQLLLEKENAQHAREKQRLQNELNSKEQVRLNLEESVRRLQEERNLEKEKLRLETEAREKALKDLTKLQNDLVAEQGKRDDLQKQCDALRKAGATVPPTCDAAERERDSFKQKFDTCGAGLKSLEQEKSNLTIKVSQLQSQCASKQSDLDLVDEELKKLKAENALLKQQNVLRDPTWQELKDFLQSDLTNTKKYDLYKYNCKGFSIELRDNARNLGYRGAYVSISYPTGVGHAINAFQTSDEGLIYVEPQHDSIKYVERGRVDTSIPIDGVKSEYLECHNPDDLRGANLLKARYTGSLFAYAYYENYERRMNCWWSSLINRTKALDKYNADVNSYNAGINQNFAESKRLDQEIIALDRWRSNLESMAKDLGRLTSDGSYLTPSGGNRLVDNIEIYWN